MTRKLVLDTNIVLDMFVFGDPGARALQAAIAEGRVEWLATAAMRDELAAVLSYEAIAARMSGAGLSADTVLRAFDAQARIVTTPAPVRIACRDTDDQKFVDLAVAHGAELLSKDKALLALRRKFPVSKAFAQ